jgi:hypothetical protein
MTYLKALLGAFIGTAIGGAVWVAIGYFTHYEVGYVAWAVGGLSGMGVAFMVSENQRDIMTGTLAVAMAVCGILASKYLVVSLLVDQAWGGAIGDEVYTPEMHTSDLAATVVDEWTAAGKQINWPAEDAADPDDPGFPPDVMQEARKRYDALTPEQRTEYAAQRREEIAKVMGGMGNQLKDAAFKDSFSPIDLVFFALAAITAFKIGSSRESVSEGAAGES